MPLFGDWILKRPQYDAAWFRQLAADAERERLALREEVMRRTLAGETIPGEDDVLRGLNAIAEGSERMAQLIEQHGGDVQAALQEFTATA